MENEIKKNNNEISKIEEPFINLFGEDTQKAIVLGKLEENEEERLNFYNAVCSCENSIDEAIEKGLCLDVKYIYLAKQSIKNQNDNGYHDAPRIVFMCYDGTSYITFSSGIYVAIKRMVSVMGMPPYSFLIKPISINKGKIRVYNIELVSKKNTKKDNNNGENVL